MIEKFPQYPTKLLNRFSMGRTNFRKRHLNKEIQRTESIRSKRKKAEMMYSTPAKKSKPSTSTSTSTTTKKQIKKSTTPVVQSSSDSDPDTDSDSEWEHEIDQALAEIRNI